MKLAEYMGAWGTPFEAFLSNDSGNRSYSYYTMGATGFVPLNDNRRVIGEWPLSKASYQALERATSKTKEHRQVSVAALYCDWRQTI